MLVAVAGGLVAAVDTVVVAPVVVVGNAVGNVVVMVLDIPGADTVAAGMLGYAEVVVGTAEDTVDTAIDLRAFVGEEAVDTDATVALASADVAEPVAVAGPHAVAC